MDSQKGSSFDLTLAVSAGDDSESNESDFEIVGVNVGGDNGFLAFDALHRIPVFHSEDEIASLGFHTVINVFEDSPVVDFACAWLFAPRIVSDLEVANFIPA